MGNGSIKVIQWQLNPFHAKPEMTLKGVLHEVILGIAMKNNDIRVPEALLPRGFLKSSMPIRNNNKDPASQRPLE